MKKLMAWLLAAVLLLAMAACGEPDPQLPGEDPTQGAAVLQEPPDARLIHRSGSITLTPAGFDWRFPNENGTMGGVIADHAHILDCENLLTPIYAAGEYGKLVFPDQPDSIEVVCWPDTAWESGGASVCWCGLWCWDRNRRIRRGRILTAPSGESGSAD